ncbi:VOC family protein [Oceanomicrobium pacificus]|uniref:VOC family protein n=1 Tax=Oceanomicrobium pacificus TaxID=2692916 RepID=A0A6B0TSH6_9RHOB|nr:VOC family protein [Oceanomicrobium pacificus]MXU64755.1 VOC family protein [Oceanomicrobium pacificus]
MEKVDGFGGLFFRAKDPAALAAWYHEHLGIDPVPSDYESRVWEQAAGPTVFAPFPADNDYFGNPAAQFMLNFRVRDLDAMVAQLTAAGIEVTPHPEPLPNGRFARLADPEGTPIELWEPADPSAG